MRSTTKNNVRETERTKLGGNYAYDCRTGERHIKFHPKVYEDNIPNVSGQVSDNLNDTAFIDENHITKQNLICLLLVILLGCLLSAPARRRGGTLLNPVGREDKVPLWISPLRSETLHKQPVKPSEQNFRLKSADKWNSTVQIALWTFTVNWRNFLAGPRMRINGSSKVGTVTELNKCYW